MTAHVYFFDENENRIGEAFLTFVPRVGEDVETIEGGRIAVYRVVQVVTQTEMDAISTRELITAVRIYMHREQTRPYQGKLDFL